jgi:putative transposase
MRQLDELHIEFPFAGSRMLRSLLALQGIKVGRRHVTTLMRIMGIEAVYRRPNTSKPPPGHRIYPYLLRGLTIDRPNQLLIGTDLYCVKYTYRSLRETKNYACQSC